MKENKGITLIALVITIIVLLLLAGVSISMLTGDNGVTINATKVQSKNEYSMVEEKMNLANTAVRMQIEEELAENSSYNATQTNNFTNLVKLVKSDLGFSDLTKTKEGKWTVEEASGVITITYTDDSISTLSGAKQNGKIVTKITIGEQKIASFDFDYVTTKAWRWTDSDSNGSITVGDLITNEEKTTEKFYVIGKNGDTVTLLSKYNLKKEGDNITLIQDTSLGSFDDYNYEYSNACAFCSETEWYERAKNNGAGVFIIGDGQEDDINGEFTGIGAVGLAEEYAKSLGANGRLMKKSEADSLNSSNPTILYGNYTTDEHLGYWIAASNGERILIVLGYDKVISANAYRRVGPSGVRPVLEISASSIE